MFDETFSDSELSVEPIKAPSRKRKPAARGGTSTAKKAKVTASSSSNSGAGVLNKRSSALASSVIANGVEFYNDAENQEDAAEAAVKLAQYTKELETALALSKSSGGGPKQRTKAELEAAAENIRKAAVSGITKQMKWRPSCKYDEAKWVYDGVCADADVFSIMMGLDGPPTWKMKKFTKDNFVDLLGRISASARYSSLRLTGKAVYVRYNADTGEFKFSGYYGIGNARKID